MCNISTEDGGEVDYRYTALVCQFCIYRDKCPQCEPEPEHCIPAEKHSTRMVTSDAETNLLSLQVPGSTGGLETCTEERKEREGASR